MFKRPFAAPLAVGSHSSPFQPLRCTLNQEAARPESIDATSTASLRLSPSPTQSPTQHASSPVPHHATRSRRLPQQLHGTVEPTSATFAIKSVARYAHSTNTWPVPDTWNIYIDAPIKSVGSSSRSSARCVSILKATAAGS